MVWKVEVYVGAETCIIGVKVLLQIESFPNPPKKTLRYGKHLFKHEKPLKYFFTRSLVFETGLFPRSDKTRPRLSFSKNHCFR